jgi:hypothetical protein
MNDKNDNIWTAEELLRHLCEQVREYISNAADESGIPERYWEPLASLLEFTTGPTPTLEAHEPIVNEGWPRIAQRFVYIGHQGECECEECRQFGRP